ncbi:MAG: hypothetical protein LQ345_007368, partial [Seirophora villosa]
FRHPTEPSLLVPQRHSPEALLSSPSAVPLSLLPLLPPCSKLVVLSIASYHVQKIRHLLICSSLWGVWNTPIGGHVVADLVGR